MADLYNVEVIRDSSILTDAFEICDIIDHEGYNCLYLDVEYAAGNAKGFQIKVETSTDGSTYFLEQSRIGGIGITAYDDNVHEKLSLSDGSYRFFIPTVTKNIRVSVIGLTDSDFVGSLLKVTAVSALGISI